MFDTTLNSMLKLEDFYLITNNYLNETINNEIRSTLAVWMLEVCEEENCTSLNFNLAMNIFDRFMVSVKNSKLNVNKSYLQLIGCACLFLSSKLRNTRPIEAIKLVEYTDNSISLMDLLELEILILQKLRYDTDSVCPNDYLEIYLARLGLSELKCLDVVQKHFYAFTALCSTEMQFSFYPSSMIAYACLMCALDGLRHLTELDCGQLGSELLKLLSNHSQIDQDCLDMLRQQVNLLLNKSASSTLVCHETNDYETCGNVKESKKRSSTCSSVSSTSSLMDFEYTHISYSCCLTPPLANQLPLPNF